jgi:hypothetical protein
MLSRKRVRGAWILKEHARRRMICAIKADNVLLTYCISPLRVFSIVLGGAVSTQVFQYIYLGDHVYFSSCAYLAQL